MKILAVDDDPIILELLAHFIDTLTDHKVVLASCADEAIDVIQANARSPFDCFLLDIQMPGTDGITLAGKIRAMEPYTDTPILMLTAMSEKVYIDAVATNSATSSFGTGSIKPMPLIPGSEFFISMVLAKISKSSDSIFSDACSIPAAPFRLCR